MFADGPCGRLLELESCGGAGSRFSARAADRKETRRSADGRYPMLNPDSGSRPKRDLRRMRKSETAFLSEQPFRVDVE